ncbi:hypothetical protein DFS34DRAFT_97544 [Phlyctochytrium arcticum]|nr:hypothetical protein DFS34DRAFT_97544 [Phlyctochytrium arcticum]
MSRHSKNNTALAFFTHAEKAKLNYGTQKQRMGRDSMRKFDACFLCLQRARDPMCCTSGHLSCKECMYENILSQKKDIIRSKKLYDDQQAQLEEARRRAADAAKGTELANFAKNQTQFQSSMMQSATDLPDGRKLLDGRVYRAITTGSNTVYAYDEEGNSQYRAALELETPKSVKTDMLSDPKSLASFWIPTLTPDAKPFLVDAPKKETMCTAEEIHHPVSIKKLIPLKFTTAKGDEEQYVCPACLKTMTNGSKIVVLKNCGHVLCKTCCGKFVRPTKKCHQCEVKCKDRDIIEFQSDGTGFSSGGGKVESSKTNVAFQ